MPRLDFYCDCKPFLSVRIDTAELTVGRAPDCTIQLPGQKVSRHHVRIRRRGKGHEIEDLSRNGTRVNHGWARGATPLAPGDRVYIGDSVFIYQPDDAPVADLQREATVVANESAELPVRRHSASLSAAPPSSRLSQSDAARKSR